jgi:membrane-bound lytic murein transglycosylase A
MFFGCSKTPDLKIDTLPNTQLIQSDFATLPLWNEENYDDLLQNFLNNCRAQKSKNIYGDLCTEASLSSDAKQFFEHNFIPMKIVANNKHQILTAYYEPELQGSLIQTQRYQYPVYETPSDLVVVDLSSVYPNLKKYRLRGKIKGGRLIPYDTREDIQNKKIPAKVLCYVDSKIDLFFLEVQGSGRIQLDNNKTIYVGYDNQNGHPYRSIGRYLIQKGAIAKEDISLQTIKKWLQEHPDLRDEVLNYNHSVVFFKQRDHKASGSLGLELTPWRSIAVDTRYIPLGSMLYLQAQSDLIASPRTVFAQDTGGAIKGSLRADLFLGFGQRAQMIAGALNAPLNLWILVPKNNIKVSVE